MGKGGYGTATRELSVLYVEYATQKLPGNQEYEALRNKLDCNLSVSSKSSMKIAASCKQDESR